MTDSTGFGVIFPPQRKITYPKYSNQKCDPLSQNEHKVAKPAFLELLQIQILHNASFKMMYDKWV